MLEHEIFQETGSSASLTYTGGQMRVRGASSDSGFGVRVLKDGRLGFAYCQEKADIEKAIDEAKKLSRFAVESPFSFAPEARYRMPDILDKSIDPDDYGTLKGYVDEARDAAESFGGRSKVICTSGLGEVGITNTAGFSGSYSQSDFYIYVECMHGDGFGYSYMASNKRPGSVRGIGIKAAGMAKDMQGAKKPDSGIYTVILEVDALESVIGVLLSSFSGDWKRRGISRLEKGKMMLSEELTICEDGLAQGSEARPFDDEGTPSRERILLEGGKVASFLYDRETAALSGVGDSGACSRGGFDTPPSIGTSNIVIRPGTCDDLSGIGDHLEIHYVHGAHTANVTTGDIGLEVSAGFMVKRGERSPVKGFMISGNVFEWLRDIEGIEKKPRAQGGFIAPRIALKDVRAVS